MPTPTGTISIQRAFELALEHHRSGRLAEAKRIYTQILAQAPDDADALQLLGLIAHDEGRNVESVELIGRAVALNPVVAEYRNNLGVALWSAGQRDAAIAAYRAAIAIKPDHADAHFNLANALRDEGQTELAVACYRDAIRLDPDMYEAHFNLGTALAELGKLEDAELSYRHALRLKPEIAGIRYALGNALRKLKRFEEAAAAYEQTLQLEPGHHDAHNNLANVQRLRGKLELAVESYENALRLKPGSAAIYLNLGNVRADQWRLDEAEACYRKVLELRPDHADAQNSLGNALSLQGRLDEAIASYRSSLERRPGIATLHVNLGNALRGQGKLDEALASYERALGLDPDHPGARWNRSLAWLLMGQFERGWDEYEWRWKHRMVPPAYSQPAWDGESLTGKTILLHAEQGLGDTIQFIRFAPLVKRRGGRVLVVCQRALVQLLSGCAGIDVIIAEGDPLPQFDIHAALMGLPRILGTTLASVPADVPYIHAEAARVAHWARELGAIPGLKIGIVWQGNPQHSLDRLRSFRLAEFAPLAQLPGVKLFSLQWGPGADQLREPGNTLQAVDLSGRLRQPAGALVEEAAVMMNLDLVISCDTAIAHLAGAIGCPVWVALPIAPDWRWLLGRDDSPWYPTMRLFRQEVWGDWPGVFSRITAALEGHSDTVQTEPAAAQQAQGRPSGGPAPP